MEVAECEIDDDGNVVRKGETVNSLSNFEKSDNSLRDYSKKNLKRLGVLYSDTDQISSPIQRTEDNFCEKNESGTSSTRTVKKFSKLASLASDINSWDDDYSHHAIKSLQQDSPKKTGAIPKTTWSSPAKTNFSSPAKTNFSSPSKSSFSSPSKTNFSSSSQKASPFKAFGSKPTDTPSSTSSDSSTTAKKLLWDKKVMDSLEAQGFTRRESSAVPKLVYDYSASKPSTSTAGTSGSPAKTPAAASTSASASFLKPSEVKKAAASSSPAKTTTTYTKTVSSTTKATIPEPPKAAPVAPAPSSSLKATPSSARSVRFSNVFNKNQKDPAEMSLKDRMAIFEKNKGTAPVPKTPYGITDANPIRSNMPELSKKYDFGFSKPQAKASPAKPTVPETVQDSAAANIKTTVQQLLTNKGTTIAEQQINDKIRKQREEDMKCILNRFNKPQESTETSDDEQMPQEKSVKKRGSSGEKYAPDQTNAEVYQKSDDTKRSRVSNTNRLYPVLSDIESNLETDSEMDNYTTATVSGSEEQETDQQGIDDEDYTDDDDMNMSFGREILNSVKKNNAPMDRSYLDSSVDSQEVSETMGDMDEYLNEALDGDESKDYDDKGSACSDSFEYERYPKRVSFKDVSDIPVKAKLEYSPAKTANGSATLVHTVSFYRRQQSESANNTPVKKVVHKSVDDEGPSHSAMVSRKAREECENKIQKLLDEVMRQQTFISQTSQALNLCASTIEFSGSTEAVEGERHLLVATHRRLACLNEVQRLKVEGLGDRIGAAREKGTLTIQEIIIPLKQTYISRLANDEINGHHLLCLVKYNEHVLSTHTLPTLPGLKSVKFTDRLTFNEVYADFKITLEIYGMTAQREVLPHDIKYHIQTPNKKRFKGKIQESNLTRPPIQSPGGPNAVRTTALVQYGYIIFSIREIKQKSWVINETAPGVSPLNGNVYLKIDSKITVDVDHCGFLTMFDDISGFGAWHRRWSRLSGNTLYYWKYPEDEKKKEALGQLDLTNIVSERVDIAPRAICARLHTILLESRRERRKDDVETLVLVPQGKHTVVR